jgi:hypothetical protein
MIPPLSARVGHDAAVRRLKGLSEQLAQVQEQISTGKKLQKPGDDAIAFARIATLRRANQGAEVQRKAMDAASARLSASDAPSGFSQSTGLPRAKAASAMTRCISCGAAITTASTAGSSTRTRQSVVARAKP